MTIDTTFLPKTNGMVFGDRLPARSDKGRVFLLGGSLDPLAVAIGQGSNWVGSNDYQVNQTVEARTASYTGGVEPVTYRYRFQFKANGTADFVNGAWTNTTNAKTPVFYTIAEAGQLKLQSQARDASDPTVQLNSVTGTKTCDGIEDLTVTVKGESYDLAAAPTLTAPSFSVNALTIQHSGNSAVTYTWSMRGGASGVFSNPSAAVTTVEIATVGTATVRCVLQSINETKVADIQFLIVGP